MFIKLSLYEISLVIKITSQRTILSGCSFRIPCILPPVYFPFSYESGTYILSPLVLIYMVFGNASADLYINLCSNSSVVFLVSEDLFLTSYLGKSFLHYSFMY